MGRCHYHVSPGSFLIGVFIIGVQTAYSRVSLVLCLSTYRRISIMQYRAKNREHRPSIFDTLVSVAFPTAK